MKKTQKIKQGHTFNLVSLPPQRPGQVPKKKLVGKPMKSGTGSPKMVDKS